MTKKEYQNLWYSVFNNSHLRKEFWVKYKENIVSYEVNDPYTKYFITTFGQTYMNQHEEAKAIDAYWKNATIIYNLGNCEAATPVPRVPSPWWFMDGSALQEKGNNPMRIDNTTATAYVTTPKSEDAVSREYLLSRLSIYDGWRSPKLRELEKFFKLDETGKPGTYEQLINAIKNDKFSLDDKAVKRLKRLQDELDDTSLEEYGYGPFYGLIFTDFPKPDRDGYDAAVEEFNAVIQTTKDTIMVKSPAEGLTALQALEAWMPVGKAN